VNAALDCRRVRSWQRVARVHGRAAWMTSVSSAPLPEELRDQGVPDEFLCDRCPAWLAGLAMVAGAITRTRRLRSHSLGRDGGYAPIAVLWDRCCRGRGGPVERDQASSRDFDGRVADRRLRVTSRDLRPNRGIKRRINEHRRWSTSGGDRGARYGARFQGAGGAGDGAR